MKGGLEKKKVRLNQIQIFFFIILFPKKKKKFMEQNHPIYVIQRVGKRTNLSQRALNEQNTINIRIKDLGAKLETVTNELNFIANKNQEARAS